MSVEITNRKTFDIFRFCERRPMSWSAVSSFEWDPEQWYQSYIMGKKMQMTPELSFGSKFASSCENRKPLAKVTMLSKMEQPFKCKFGKLWLTGFADTFDHVGKKKFGEYKTGVKAWDQKRADEHGQITMYALMNYLISRIRPEDCRFFLEWIPTQKKVNSSNFGAYTIEFVKGKKVLHFDTKRTMKQMLEFGDRLNKTALAMQEYVRNHD